MASKNNKKPIPSSKPASTSHQEEAKAPVEPTNHRKLGTPVVGIGASAGGLKALENFFAAMPPQTGLAFVVVTHLSPDHESHMAEILQKYSSMPTRQVTKKIKVAPNHVYVIPPNRAIVMTDSHLDIEEFKEQHGHRTPIDHFFRSLASTERECVAIILSGGGTDGSVGIKDVKELGGILMAQDPDEAEFDSMPRAAIATGLMDVILPAGQLPGKLANFIRHRPQLPHDPGQFSEQELEIVQRILAQVHARTGQDFNQYKPSTVLRRIERRMQLNSLITLELYLNFMRQNESEAHALFNDILIGVTNFFRDRASWKSLENTVIPALLAEKQNDGDIRIWTIGCATGEEAYSLAMLLFEQAARLERQPRIQIFASDLDDRSISRGREGLYPAAIAADVSPERLERFFTREGEYYRVKPEIRDAILFTSHNVLRDPPFTRQDLVVCRNVMIYLQRNIQEKMFEVFHYSLNKNSYLFLGTSESAEHLPELFNVLDKTHRIYQTRPWKGPSPRIPAMALAVPSDRSLIDALPSVSQPRPTVRSTFSQTPRVEEHHRKALESYGPPSILINDRYFIHHISETAGRYLMQPKGPITGDLLKLARPELQMELRATLFGAFESNQAMLSRSIAVQFDGHPRQVVISVHPQVQVPSMGNSTENQALVIFLEGEIEEGASDPLTTQRVSIQREQSQIVAQLESEVGQLREHLQLKIEEYESSQEEMRAANEELQSINEEYRSATEELETGKEELQSVNEELLTVNSELKNRLEDILLAHRELESLMGATEVATLFLDRELHIQRFTPSISEHFNLVPNDAGRPINHINHHLEYDEFLQDAEEVLRNLTTVEKEVRSANRKYYLLRIRPYRTVDDKIDGVVITMVDITRRKETERLLLQSKRLLEERVTERTRELDELNVQLRHTRDLFYGLFHTNPLPTALSRMDDAIIVDVNKAYLKYFGVERSDVIDHSAQSLDLPIDPAIRPELIARLKREGPIHDLEMRIQHPSGEERIILNYLQPLKIGDTDTLIQTFTDITDRVTSAQQMRALATELTQAEQEERRRISQILHDDLQQRLFAIKMQVTILQDTVQNADNYSGQVDFSKLNEWLSESLSITRNLSTDLSPAILRDEGLTDALLWLAAQMRDQYGLNVKIEPNDVDTHFEDTLRILLFQAVRESLFNIVKHANTPEAFVSLENVNEHTRLTIKDQGDGFNTDGLVSKTIRLGGLLNLRDRLTLMGCRLQIISRPGDGTRVIIDIFPKAESPK